MFRYCLSFRVRHFLIISSCVSSLIGGTVFLARGADNATSRRTASIEKQVEGLLVQMTLDEKIGQMVQVDSGALTNKADVKKYFLGSVLSGGSSDPPMGNSAQDWLKLVSEFKSYVLQTRLKIPLIYGIDAVHGHNNVDGAVIFPASHRHGRNARSGFGRASRTYYRRRSSRHRDPLGVCTLYRRGSGRTLGTHL